MGGRAQGCRYKTLKSLDGVSANGAIYALDRVPGASRLALVIAARYDFDGGPGSTPSVSNDGQRLYIINENGNVMALDRNLQEIR